MRLKMFHKIISFSLVMILFWLEAGKCMWVNDPTLRSAPVQKKTQASPPTKRTSLVDHDGSNRNGTAGYGGTATAISLPSVTDLAEDWIDVGGGQSSTSVNIANRNKSSTSMDSSGRFSQEGDGDPQLTSSDENLSHKKGRFHRISRDGQLSSTPSTSPASRTPSPRDGDLTDSPSKSGEVGDGKDRDRSYEKSSRSPKRKEGDEVKHRSSQPLEEEGFTYVGQLNEDSYFSDSGSMVFHGSDRQIRTFSPKGRASRSPARNLQASLLLGDISSSDDDLSGSSKALSQDVRTLFGAETADERDTGGKGKGFTRPTYGLEEINTESDEEETESSQGENRYTGKGLGYKEIAGRYGTAVSPPPSGIGLMTLTHYSPSLNGDDSGDLNTLIPIEAKGNFAAKLIPAWCKTKGNGCETLYPSDQDALLEDSQLESSQLSGAPPFRGRSPLDQVLDQFEKDVKIDLQQTVGPWEQAGAMLIGAGIGGGAAYGISVLYIQAMFNLAIQFDDRFAPLIGTPDLYDYILFSTLFDSATRNALYGKKILLYLSRREASMKEAVFLGAVSFLPSLITPFALITAGFEKINFFQDPSFTSQVVKLMQTYSPILYVNDWGFNINMASDIKSNMRKWAETSPSRLAAFLAGKIFYSNPTSPEEIHKRHFNENLDALIEALPLLSPEKVEEIYETIQTAKASIVTELPDLDPENLEAAESFLTFRYLLALCKKTGLTSSFYQDGNQTINTTAHFTKPARKSEKPSSLANHGDFPSSSGLLLGEEEKQNIAPQTGYKIYETMRDYLINGCLALGTPVRLITLKYIVQDILASIAYAASGAEVGEIVRGFSWGIAFVVGLAAQTGFEYKGMKNFAEMIWSGHYEGHESYPWARRMAKLGSTVQGFILAVPIAVLALQACTAEFGEDWLKNPDYTAYKWASLPFILAYLLPEWAVQTTLTEDSYNKTLLTGGMDAYHQGIPYVYNEYIQPQWNEHISEAPLLENTHPSRSYQQDWLIRFIKDKQEQMHYLHPEILFQLEKLI